MRNFVIQPEYRHYIVFGLIKKVLSEHNHTIYITDRSTRLPFSNSSKDQICFNSWGFTFYSLKNLFQILSYNKFIIVVHSASRFVIDFKRFNKFTFLSYYYLVRSIFDKIFYILLAIRGDIQVCLLEQSVINYILDNPKEKLFQRLLNVQFVNLSKVNKINIRKYYISEIDQLHFKSNGCILKLLSIGNFSEERISYEKIKKLNEMLDSRSIRFTLDIIGQFDDSFKQLLDSEALLFNYLGVLSEDELLSTARTNVDVSGSKKGGAVNLYAKNYLVAGEKPT